MNNPSPLVPQGTTPPRPKSSLYFKVLMILTVHVVVIGGMLLQGCKDTNSAPKTDASTSSQTASASPDTSAANTNNTPDTTSLPPQQPLPTVPSVSNAAVNPTPTLPPTASTPLPNNLPPTVATQPPGAASMGDTREYAVIHGDTLATIAHRNGVSLKSLMDANPGVNPRKLRVGQKLELPASSGAAATTAATGSAGAMDATAPAEGSSGIYTVKSGDMLLRIAHSHGTTVKKIMALNDLKSTSIRVGQKLKLPAPKSAAPAADSTAPAASAMQPLPSSGPVSVSASAAPTPASAVAN